MRAQLRAELLKQRSTRTGLGLLAGLLGLVLAAELLHGFGLAAKDLSSASAQLMVFGRGEFLAVLFAALLGALSITNEIRHGTIRPTFLVNPSRGRVIAAKIWVSAVIGAGFGLVGSALATGVGTAALRARGINIHLVGADYVFLVVGGSAAAALWAVIGVGLGAVVREQVPTLIAISAWILFVEGLLVGDIAGQGVAEVGRFAPGAAGQALSGQGTGTLLGPVSGGLLLAAYAAIATTAGWLGTVRRDVN